MGQILKLYHLCTGGKMRKLIILVGAILISTASFAATPSNGFSKNSTSLEKLGAAWKTEQHVKKNSSDLTIVYGGADVSHKPTLVSRATIT